MAKTKTFVDHTVETLRSKDRLAKETLESNIEYYFQIHTAKAMLEKSEDVAKANIIKQLRGKNLKTLTTPAGFVASISISNGKRYISLEEAKELLDDATYTRLVKAGDPYDVLTVKKEDHPELS